MSATTGLIVSLALVALPDFHITYLSRGAGLKILLDDVAPYEIELEITLWTFQNIRNP